MTVGVVLADIVVVVVAVIVAVIVADIVVVGGSVISLALKYIWWDLFNDISETH